MTVGPVYVHVSQYISDTGKSILFKLGDKFRNGKKLVLTNAVLILAKVSKSHKSSSKKRFQQKLTLKSSCLKCFKNIRELTLKRINSAVHLY